MKERNRYKLPHPVSVFPGDKFICSVTEKGQCYEFREDVGRKMVIDTILTFDVDEELLGLEDGIGAVFGKANNEKDHRHRDERRPAQASA